MTDEPAGRDPSHEDELSSATTRKAPLPHTATEFLGPYRLVQKVGEGGMGEVWLAEQTAPLRRKVALKLIKAGMDTSQVIARFEAERQALALMDHPSIAKVFDAGATLRGLPYFAMEYVSGEPITLYCDRHRLTTPQRLELFSQVCDGVQHAHQKGVIHRDLKPSNVLVTIQSDTPVPKIIDFGVAKATAQRLTERTLFTELGVLIGTPEYMSPEQAEMTGLDVDTRTDVYSLGVMLYELLSGALPFDSRELRQAGFEEIRRRIREVEPARPSTRVRSLGEKSTQTAKNRSTEPARLASRLKGDLDWIVMKALEKDRTRRYGSAADLAADVQRHLQHQPVVAGPPSAAYRAGKFVRRHRFGVAVAAVGVVGLVAFAMAMAAQAARIATERDRANKEAEVSRRVSEFMTGLFQVSDPSEARGNSLTAREILDRGADKIESELADSPEIQAQLMHTIGEVYFKLGLFGKAEPLVARAVETRNRVLGPGHPETLRSRHRLAAVYWKQGRLREADQLIREVLDARRRVLGQDHPDTFATLNNLAGVNVKLGRLDESEKYMREHLEASRRVHGPNHEETLRAMSNLSNLYRQQQRWPEAERLGRDALDLQRRSLGPDHPSTIHTMDSLAYLLLVRGRLAESEQVYHETLELRRRVLGPEHPDTLATMHFLAATLARQGRHDEGEKLMLETLEIQRRVLGPNHPEVARSLYGLACLESLRGRPTEALDWLRQAVEAGFNDVRQIAEDPELESLHGDPRFDTLLATVKKNAEK